MVSLRAGESRTLIRYVCVLVAICFFVSLFVCLFVCF